jgi:hypothetical protein
MGLEISPVTGGAIVNNRRETSVSGVFACGNVLHVHDLADYVTIESQLAGRAAASFIQSNQSERQNAASVSAEDGVRYIVPQKLLAEEPEAVTLYFRVMNIYKNAQIVLEKNGVELLRRKRGHLSPGEMETLVVRPDWLCGLTSDDMFTVRLEF